MMKNNRFQEIQIEISKPILEEYKNLCESLGVNINMRIGTLIVSDLEILDKFKSLDDGKNKKLTDFFPELKK